MAKSLHPPVIVLLAAFLLFGCVSDTSTTSASDRLDSNTSVGDVFYPSDFVLDKSYYEAVLDLNGQKSNLTLETYASLSETNRLIEVDKSNGTNVSILLAVSDFCSQLNDTKSQLIELKENLTSLTPPNRVKLGHTYFVESHQYTIQFHQDLIDFCDTGDEEYLGSAEISLLNSSDKFQEATKIFTDELGERVYSSVKE